MEIFDRAKYDCLSEDSFKELLEVGYTPADILEENQRKKNALEMFLSRNTLTKHHDIRGGNLNNSACPHVYVFGYEDEGKQNMEQILKSENSDLSNFTFEFVEGTITRSKISQEFCRNIKNIKSRMKRMDVPTAFVMVMNCSIFTTDDINKQSRDELLMALGPEVLIRCVLVLTHGKDILKEMPLEKHYGEITNGRAWMSNLYSRFYPRIIAVDTNDNSSYGNRCQRKQLKRLLLHTCARFDKPIRTTRRVKFHFFMYGMSLTSLVWILVLVGLFRWYHGRLP